MHLEVTSACLLLGIILVQCRYYEYHYISLQKNWTDAQKYCRGYYTDLATIESAEDANRITLPVNWAWIGLTDDPASWRGVLTADSNSWKWSTTETTSPGGYQNFANLEPDNHKAAEWCVFMEQSGWKDYYCSSQLDFFCYDVLPSGIKQYHLFTTLKNWADAQTYCRQYHVDLAMIESATENQEVLNILLENPTAGWIGLYREPYRWSDGSNSTFRRWDSYQPSGGTEFCASQRSNYYWNDVPCDMNKEFVCHGALKQASKVQTKYTLKTTANMVDPAIKDMFLKVLDSRLDGNGINFSLKWINAPTKQVKKKAQSGCSSV